MSIDPKFARNAAIASGAVTTKAFLILGGYWVGNQLDLKFGTKPVLMLLGLSLGVGLGLWNLLRLINQMNR